MRAIESGEVNREGTRDAISEKRVGATSIEYAMIAAGIGIGVVIVGVVSNLGTKVKVTFTTMQNAFK